MAAHILTALDQMIEKPDPEKFAHALDYALLGDQLDYEDWVILHMVCDLMESPDALKGACIVLRPKYYKQFIELDSPSTAEEWNRAKWGNK